MNLFFKYEYKIIEYLIKSRDSSVGLATGHGLDGRGSIPGAVRRFFSSQRPDRLWDPPSLPSNGYRSCFPRGKAAGVWSWPLTFIQRRGHEWWSYTSTPLYFFMAWLLIKQAQRQLYLLTSCITVVAMLPCVRAWLQFKSVKLEASDEYTLSTRWLRN
jgi:hypothetical protein